MEKIPAESGPWTIGVSKTCQVWPRSGEWKTRATLPPVANQMLESRAEASFFSVGLRGAEALLFHGCAGGVAVAAASVVRNPCGASGDAEMQGFLRLRHAVRFAIRVSPLRMTELRFGARVGRMARQVLLAANAPSPSIAGGSWAG